MTKQSKNLVTLLFQDRLVRTCLFLLLSFLISGITAKAHGQPPEQLPTNERDLSGLEIGKSIQRELAKTERHSYQISLRADELILVIVEQRGINVAVTVLGPSRERITEVDSRDATQGPESVLFITRAAGKYSLDVYSSDQQAPTGAYELRIEERRPATPQDKNRLAANQLVAEGQQLFAQATAPSLLKAIDKLNEALILWRLVEERRAEAVTLSQIGRGYDLLGEKIKALNFYQKALPLLQAVKDDTGEATTLNNIGLVYDSLGEKPEALRYYTEALPILRRTGARRVEGYTLNNIGLLYDSVGEKQKALDSYARALEIFQAAGDRRAEGATLNNIGFVYNSLGQKERALDYFGRALPILQAVGDHRVEAITTNNVGYVYESLGEQQKALEYFNQALPILRLVGDRRVEAITLNNIGLVYSALSEKQKALEYFNLSLPLRRQVGDRQGEAITLGDLGRTYVALDQPVRALDYYAKALSLARAVEDRSLEASILRGVALVERDRGNLVEARIKIETALEVIESLRIKIASQELRASYFASAQQYFETYIDVLMRLHERHPNEGFDGKALQASERARARSLLEMLTEAGASVRQGINPELLRRQRSLQQMLNAKAALQNRLMQGEHKPDQVAELRKEIPLLLAQYDDLEAQIRISSPRYATLTQPTPLSLREIQERVLDSDTLLLEYSLGSERSYLWAVTSDSLKSIELPRRSEIELAARHLYDLLLERNRFVKFETAAERQRRIATADAEYLRKAATLSRVLLGPVASQLGSAKKRRLLIIGDGALNYLPFGALPLPEEQHSGKTKTVRRPSPTSEGASPSSLATSVPLIVVHEIVTLPSASTLDVLRRETSGRKPADKTLAVLADPVFERSDSRLKGSTIDARSPVRGIKVAERDDVGERVRGAVLNVSQSTSSESGRIQRLLFTRQEAEEILSLVPKEDRLKALDFDANLTTATSPDLGRYRFVHFGTHGLLDSAHPELSGIVLSLFDREGREQDGFLRVNEIFNLKLPVELVVLSGCRTGLGKEIKGEGLVGLTRAFMYAGAARIVVSLWDVSDEASARLMVHFYRGMLGPEQLSPSSALRAAQIALWREGRWQAPYYWAAFVLQGEFK